MRKSTSFLGIALAGAIALLLPMKADATCGNSLSFAGYYSKVTGTGAGLRSNFWLLNAGVPAVGAGTDNGGAVATALVSPWLINYGGNMVISSNWSGNQLYDGCPDGSGIPVPDMRMVVSFSDVSSVPATLGQPTFAVSCAHRDPAAAYEFNFPPGTQAAPADLALVVAPKASITNTVRNAATGEATITIGSPVWTAGFYTDGSSGCDAATVIPSFDVYKQQTARGTAPSASNDGGAGAAWTLVTTCQSSGPACTVTTNCGATNCDNYLAVVPHFNSNFTTAQAADGATALARVGVKSANVQAGPTLAVTPKPKVVPNPRVEAPRQKTDQ